MVASIYILPEVVASPGICEEARVQTALLHAQFSQGKNAKARMSAL